MAVDNILPHEYFKTLLPELKRRQLGVTLFYEIKANLKREQVELLRDAGVAALQPGIESLSTPVLRLMRKGTTAPPERADAEARPRVRSPRQLEPALRVPRASAPRTMPIRRGRSTRSLT